MLRPENIRLVAILASAVALLILAALVFFYRRAIYLRLAWGVAFSYLCFLFTMTHMPKPPHVFEKASDKTLHMGAYGALALLTYIAISLNSPRFRLIIPVVLLFAMIAGAIDEWTQPYFGRACDFNDWTADVSGAAIAVSVCEIARRLFFSRSSGATQAAAL